MDKQDISLYTDLSGAELPDHVTGHHADEPAPVSYSAKTLQHGRHPTNLRRMENPDAHATCVGWCSEVMEIYVRVDGERITEATFWADGCISTTACADMLTTMACGKTPEEAAAIAPETLIAALDGLPHKSHHCAELAVETLRAALAELPRG